MPETEYDVRGFLTLRANWGKTPLSGSLTLRTDPGSGLFAGEFILHESAVTRTVARTRLLRATVQITPESPVIGQIDREGRVSATVTVNAVITALQVGGLTLIDGGSCRTVTHAVVPLRSQPGFDLAKGGRLAGRYYRPPFTGCGRITPFINLLLAGPGRAVVIDLISRS